MSLSAELPHLRRGFAARVLRGAQAVELRSAETVVAPAALSAHQDPEATAAASLAAAADAARAEGYAEGYAAALTSLEAARQRALDAAAGRLAAAAASAATSREALVADIAEDALSLTYQLAETILGDEGLLRALPAQAVVMRALRLAPEGEDLVVRVPPSCELDAEELAGLCGTSLITIQQDPAIEEGGCIVEAGACRIDAQLSTALARVRKVLAEARGHEARQAPREGTGE